MSTSSASPAIQSPPLPAAATAPAPPTPLVPLSFSSAGAPPTASISTPSAVAAGNKTESRESSEFEFLSENGAKVPGTKPATGELMKAPCTANNTILLTLALCRSYSSFNAYGPVSNSSSHAAGKQACNDCNFTNGYIKGDCAIADNAINCCHSDSSCCSRYVHYTIRRLISNTRSKNDAFCSFLVGPPDDASGGIFGRLLSKVAEKTKNSVETMITTLDPQMKEYIYSGGDIEIVVTSDAESKVLPVRESFQRVFGHATVIGIKAHSAVAVAEQPVGYAAGKQGALERIQNFR
jgi:hypothetical protein